MAKNINVKLYSEIIDEANRVLKDKSLPQQDHDRAALIIKIARNRIISLHEDENDTSKTTS